MQGFKYFCQMILMLESGNEALIDDYFKEDLSRIILGWTRRKNMNHPKRDRPSGFRMSFQLANTVFD